MNTTDWEMVEGDTKVFFSKLRLQQAHYLDTGPYVCQYKDTGEELKENVSHFVECFQIH